MLTGMALTRLYKDGNLELKDFPVQDISDHLEDPASMVWLDLCRPGPEDFDMIQEEFGLHELALEDARHEHQRPRLDHYRSHQFISAYATAIDPGTAELITSEIAIFVTEQAVITIRTDDGFAIEEVVARWDESPDLAKHGVGFLVHGLLDHVVDGHFDTVQRLDDYIEALEDLLFEEGRQEIRTVQRRCYDLRKSLVRLRRVVLPMREVVNSLMHPGMHVVGEPLMPYYQDVYGHVLRVTEWTESLREMVTSVLETNLTVQGNSMNLIMKKVTSWAAIIAVPTAVTGFYGQNVPYPGFSQQWGFVVSTAAIVVLSLLLYVSFKVKDWI
jgi:magnesium transporter